VVHIYLGTVAARAFTFLSRVPAARVVSFHGGDLSDDLSQAEFHTLLKHVDLLLVRSHSLREELERRGCQPNRIRLNRTGIPLPTTFPCSQPPAPATPVRVLQACRLIEKKGLDITLAAVARLISAGRDVSLDLVGSGPEEARLRRIAEEAGISNSVQFLGFLDNAELLKRLPQYHLFVHPSRTTQRGDREGIPNSLLEAMAYGVPIVATRHSGIPEAVRHEDNGLLVDRPCADAVATAMARLLDDRELYVRIARRGQETVRSEFSIPACVQALEQSYEEAIELAQARVARQPLRRAS
jgi:glycosyltransferase involved in cell wall biosynthesis